MDISRYLAEEGKKIDLTQWSTTCDVDIDKKKVNPVPLMFAVMIVGVLGSMAGILA